jgi:hypothetical protein
MSLFSSKPRRERCRSKIFYQISANDNPVVYLRCKPITYEVFAIDKAEVLPDCPQLGTRLKFGLSHNFTEREESFKQNGVFVFFVALESTDDTILLENARKKNFRMQRKCGTMELLQLEALKMRFQEEHAKTVLSKVNETIIETVQDLSFLYTLRATIFTAKDVSEMDDGVRRRTDGRDWERQGQTLPTARKTREGAGGGDQGAEEAKCDKRCGCAPALGLSLG